MASYSTDEDRQPIDSATGAVRERPDGVFCLPTFHQLMTSASIVLVQGERVEQYTVNVYSKAISLSTPNATPDQTYDGQLPVVLNADGAAHIENVRGVPYRFEFYHATPFQLPKE